MGEKALTVQHLPQKSLTGPILSSSTNEFLKGVAPFMAALTYTAHKKQIV